LIPLSAGTDKPVITVTTARTASISIKLKAERTADSEGFVLCLATPALWLRLCPWGERLNFGLLNDMAIELLLANRFREFRSAHREMITSPRSRDRIAPEVEVRR